MKVLFYRSFVSKYYRVNFWWLGWERILGILVKWDGYVSELLLGVIRMYRIKFLFCWLFYLSRYVI